MTEILQKKSKELLDVAAKVRNSDASKAAELAEQALEIARVENDLPTQAAALLSVGASYKALSRFPDSFDATYRALELFRETGERPGIADSIGLLGNLYFFLGDHEQALRLQREALEIRETTGDERRIAYSINSIGVIYATLEDFKTAEQYFQRSYDVIARLNDSYGLAIMINNLAMASYEQKKYAKAIPLFFNAEDAAQKNNDISLLGEIYVNMGDCYRDKGDLNSSEEAYNRALAVVKDKKNLTESKYFSSYAKLKLVKKEFQAALIACNAAMDILNTVGIKDYLAKNYKLLADIQSAAEKPQEAIATLNSYFSLREEMYKDELKKRTENLNLIHQSETLRKEAEINYLKNVELKKAYDKIGTINQNLTDSIQYARYYQDIIFGKYEKQMKSSFPASFYLSKPKDIVSGDFMWFCQKKDHAIFAMADCTGHGVPGAFVSMLGNDLLNKAVMEEDLYMPHEIMHFIHLALRKHFPEVEVAPKQGLDMLVVKINQNGGLSWSGARSQGLLLRKGLQPQEVKGDRVFLGGSLEHDFSSWEASMKRGDRLFLYTDGILDQKGEKGKFSQQRLSSSLSGKGDMLSLSDSLLKALSDWQGAEAQVDDISVAGIEF